MEGSGVWPRTTPVLASYDPADVTAFLMEFYLGLMALLRLVDSGIVEGGVISNGSPPARRRWIFYLPATLNSPVDWERALVAYEQLLQTFEVFAKPFDPYLLMAAELGNIPEQDIAFERWVQQCIQLLLTSSRVNTVRSTGLRSSREFSEAVRGALVVADLVRKTYVESDR
jgi:hypothetical protein